MEEEGGLAWMRGSHLEPHLLCGAPPPLPIAATPSQCQLLLYHHCHPFSIIITTTIKIETSFALFWQIFQSILTTCNPRSTASLTSSPSLSLLLLSPSLASSSSFQTCTQRQEHLVQRHADRLVLRASAKWEVLSTSINLSIYAAKHCFQTNI